MAHTQEPICWVLDSRSQPLARGELLSPPNAPMLQLRVLENLQAVLEHEAIQLLPMDDGTPPLLGRILSRREDCLLLEPQQALGRELQQNLRIPVSFHTFLYPVTGTWRGRARVLSKDLSCGGVAFFSSLELAPGERAEIVIPRSREPLVLTCEILRQRPSNPPLHLYAAKFVNLTEGEEFLVRETVFNIQLLDRNAGPRPARPSIERKDT